MIHAKLADELHVELCDRRRAGEEKLETIAYELGVDYSIAAKWTAHIPTRPLYRRYARQVIAAIEAGESPAVPGVPTRSAYNIARAYWAEIDARERLSA